MTRIRRLQVFISRYSPSTAEQSTYTEWN